MTTLLRHLPISPPSSIPPQARHALLYARRPYLGVALHQALLHDLDRGLKPPAQLGGRVRADRALAASPRCQALRYVAH